MNRRTLIKKKVLVTIEEFIISTSVVGLPVWHSRVFKFILIIKEVHHPVAKKTVLRDNSQQGLSYLSPLLQTTMEFTTIFSRDHVHVSVTQDCSTAFHMREKLFFSCIRRASMKQIYFLLSDVWWLDLYNRHILETNGALKDLIEGREKESLSSLFATHI